MFIKLEPGQSISITAYKGSQKDAHIFQGVANRYRNSGLPMPIEGCDVELAIENIQMLKVPVMSSSPVTYGYIEDGEAKLNYEVTYAVMLSGKLV